MKYSTVTWKCGETGGWRWREGGWEFEMEGKPPHNRWLMDGGRMLEAEWLGGDSSTRARPCTRRWRQKQTVKQGESEVAWYSGAVMRFWRAGRGSGQGSAAIDWQVGRVNYGFCLRQVPLTCNSRQGNSTARDWTAKGLPPQDPLCHLTSHISPSQLHMKQIGLKSVVSVMQTRVYTRLTWNSVHMQCWRTVSEVLCVLLTAPINDEGHVRKQGTSRVLSGMQRRNLISRSLWSTSEEYSLYGTMNTSQKKGTV